MPTEDTSHILLPETLSKILHFPSFLSVGIISWGSCICLHSLFPRDSPSMLQDAQKMLFCYPPMLPLLPDAPLLAVLLLIPCFLEALRAEVWDKARVDTGIFRNVPLLPATKCSWRCCLSSLSSEMPFSCWHFQPLDASVHPTSAQTHIEGLTPAACFVHIGLR